MVKQCVAPFPGVIQKIYSIALNGPAYLLVVEDTGPVVSLYIINSNFDVLFTKIGHVQVRIL